MNLIKYYRKKDYRTVVGALTASVVGVYTEPIYLFLYLLYISFNRKLILQHFLVFFILLFHGLLMNQLTGYHPGKMFQQIILLSVVLYGYVNLYYYSKIGIERWFAIYVNLVYLLSILGLVQFVFKFMTGINIFPYTLELRITQNTLRVHSIMLEAGHLALFFIPAVCYIMISRFFLRNNKKQSLIILLAAVLTFSSSMYIGIIMALFFRFYDRLKKLKIFFYISICVFAVVVSNIRFNDSEYEEGSGLRPAYQKILQTAEAFSNIMDSSTSPELFEHFNASTYATMTNGWIALNAPYRLVGTGIGTHQQNYELMYSSSYYLYGLNKEDGYSLFVRMLSEFGYVGIFLYFCFVIKYYNGRNILSLCLLVFIISALLKGGHYTLHCTALFHFLYYKCSNRLIDEPTIDNCFMSTRKQLK